MATDLISSSASAAAANASRRAAGHLFSNAPPAASSAAYRESVDPYGGGSSTPMATGSKGGALSGAAAVAASTASKGRREPPKVPDAGTPPSLASPSSSSSASAVASYIAGYMPQSTGEDGRAGDATPGSAGNFGLSDAQLLQHQSPRPASALSLSVVPTTEAILADPDATAVDALVSSSATVLGLSQLVASRSQVPHHPKVASANALRSTGASASASSGIGQGSGAAGNSGLSAVATYVSLGGRVGTSSGLPSSASAASSSSAASGGMASRRVGTAGTIGSSGYTSRLGAPAPTTPASGYGSPSANLRATSRAQEEAVAQSALARRAIAANMGSPTVGSMGASSATPPASLTSPRSGRLAFVAAGGMASLSGSQTPPANSSSMGPGYSPYAMASQAAALSSTKATARYDVVAAAAASGAGTPTGASARGFAAGAYGDYQSPAVGYSAAGRSASSSSLLSPQGATSAGTPTSAGLSPGGSYVANRMPLLNQLLSSLDLQPQAAPGTRQPAKRL
jgi:hypothetical protein